MKNPSLLILVAVLVLVMIASVLWFLPGRAIKSKTVQTIQLMQRISIDFALLTEPDRLKLDQLVKARTESEDLNRILADFLQKIKDPYITNSSRSVSKNGLYHDAWGVPLACARANGPTYEKLNSQLKQCKPYPFFIWSTGPNRSNEFGFGDDLFLHE
ncbi:MAG: hypothetical protein ACO1QB_10330 [Verrucomicrobiales bacterium]